LDKINPLKAGNDLEERYPLDADFLTGAWVGVECLIATAREGQSVINDEYCFGPTAPPDQGDVLLCGEM